MAKQPLSADVKNFIDAYIDSVEQLEILLLVRSASRLEWSARRVSEAIRTSEPSAAGHLANLAERGILMATSESPILYRYAPSSDSLDKAIANLSSAYAGFRFRVIDAILDKPSDYVRVYADAFRIRKGDDDG
jgi:hypothetical protein